MLCEEGNAMHGNLHFISLALLPLHNDFFY